VGLGKGVGVWGEAIPSDLIVIGEGCGRGKMGRERVGKDQSFCRLGLV